ncbi:uncharacterized protein F5147DRAFT_773791 [Suillus discolor]|uniref:Uncharacterized protein n=1 Tax=Suillus discolor TaxID=1912936 RepID=A0A9P7F5W6_9AGAM|nr:uncharacterized protein F5147DRAFT_773791 [Suillus discolor]KAG2108212.1 hypothetical protein F5147DRAFT_773791 [Suillus discolor]
MADTKSSRGLAATGVGTVDCARHEMKLASGVGDLQKGKKVATSTKEMGPGSCRDILDDNFSDWNWKKVTTVGHILLCKLKEAVGSAKMHSNELAELQSAIDAVSLYACKSEVEAWEDDSSQPNPFESCIACK